MLKIQFPFFGHGATHGDGTTSVTFADVVKHSALALIGRRHERETTPYPAESWVRDETGLPPLPDEPTPFLIPREARRLPSDSPLRADIGLLPLDHF
jgi:hypothetical protein